MFIKKLYWRIFAALFTSFVLLSGLISNAVKPVLAATNSPIVRNEVMTRAQVWVDAHVPYSNYNYYLGYRADCSGFVSYAWRLQSSEGSPESRTTRSLPGVSFKITKEELLPGDILLWVGSDSCPNGVCDGHAVLFGGWRNSDKTKYWAIEQTGGGTIAHEIDYPYWGGIATMNHIGHIISSMDLRLM